MGGSPAPEEDAPHKNIFRLTHEKPWCKAPGHPFIERRRENNIETNQSSSSKKGGRTKSEEAGKKGTKQKSEKEKEAEARGASKDSGEKSRCR